MHPNAFLKSLWRNEILNQVFVAMSFEEQFLERYEKVIKPAIESVPIAGITLRAYRVDNSKTGDSILTDIVDGIAHSRLVLADVSVIDEGRYKQAPVRNGNVMYEIGVALACRMPSEVLLIRDDSKKFLFDVSTIPHMKVDFSDHGTAIKSLREKLADRLSEIKRLEDARVKMAGQALTQDEVRILKVLNAIPSNQLMPLSTAGLNQLSFPDQRGLDGLIARGCITSPAMSEDTEEMLYGLNEFGYALANFVEYSIKKLRPIQSTEISQDGKET